MDARHAQFAWILETDKESLRGRLKSRICHDRSESLIFVLIQDIVSFGLLGLEKPSDKSVNVDFFAKAQI